MTTAATSLLGLALPVTGELSGTWGDTVNNSITALLDSAVAGTTTLSADVDVTLTTTTLAANQAREAIILWTAAGTVTRYITAPAQSKIYAVLNKSSTQSIVLRGVGPTTGVTILAGKQAMVAWDGTDYVEISSGYVDGPATSTDNAVARFDGTDGKLLQNSVVLIADTTGNMTGVGTLSSGAITSSSLTATRVLFAGTSGLIQDDADLTFNGTILTSTGFAGPLNGTVGATTPAAGYFTDVSATGQVTSTKAGSATTGAGQFYLNGATSNRIDFNSNGATTPSFTTRSDGTKLTLFPALSGSQVDYAIGISAATQWYSVPVNSNSFFFKWFGGETQIASLDGTGALTLAGGVTLNGGTANGVTYLNGSKVLTSGTALTFDGTTFTASSGGSTPALRVFGAGTSQGQISFNLTDSYKIQGGPDYLAINFFTNGINRYSIDSAGVAIWSVAGSEAMRLTSTGLGIGTSSPSAKLDVLTTVIGNSNVIMLGNNEYGAATYLSSNSTSLIFNRGASFKTGAIVSSNQTSGSLSEGYLAFQTSSSNILAERMRLDSSGNLGLGGTPVTWTNGKAIEIYGVNYALLALRSSNAGATWRDWALASNYNNAGELNFIVGASQGATPSSVAMTLNSSGNLGLGVTPSAWTRGKNIEMGWAGNAVMSPTSASTALSQNAYFATSWKYGQSSIATALYEIGSGGHTWYNAPSGTAGAAITFTQAMTLDASGNLLVGTTSNPSNCRFVVEGPRAASFTSTQADASALGAGNSSSNADEATINAGNGSAASAGVGVYGSSLGNGNGAQANTSCYHFRGVTQGVALYYLYGNGTTSFTSDLRLKKNVETARDGYLADLCQLRVVKYNWNTAPEGEARELGLVAQEVEQVFPGLVQDATDEIQGINPKVLKASVLPFMLLKAIQEQQAMIEELKTRLAALEAK